ncbi:major capsid protein [Gordonia alkanivorans]|uniref:Phage major capsid protein n=1 Tax=Gordonia alkanivorans NBRC 16433 TaxID=1027371 RepID=F9VVE2_9ACTN|nr:major capsid protein [Gordonia alkanivorans]GAA12571.1 hypothetical protein GOALK_056_00040 [Gordonia alkanivorans NBRC 16433]
MPTPTTSMLLPTLTGSSLTVDAFLKNPTRITARVAQLTDKQLIAPWLFHTIGQPVVGGGVLWASLQKADQFASGDIGPRSPGAEYPQLQAVSPEPQLSKVEDYGGTQEIPEEAIKRNDLPFLDQCVTQLANDVAMKLDRRAFETLNTEMTRIGSELDVLANAAWDTVQLDGATPTDPISRPTASFAKALMSFELDELGVIGDTLIVHPEQAAVLRTVYGSDLTDVLASFGLTMVSNPRATPGTALVVQAGECGVIQFEEPLTTRIIQNEINRTVTIQVFAVPAFAPNFARAARRITGTATP